MSCLHDFIILNDMFLHFWKDEMVVGEGRMIDPSGRQYIMMVEENECGSLQTSRGVLQMVGYYKFKSPHTIHFKYIGDNSFQFRIYSDVYKDIFYCSNPPKVQRRYFHEEYDPANFFYSIDKTLSGNDAKS